ncbi:C47 family peptidase [Staphylococcus aureus]
MAVVGNANHNGQEVIIIWNPWIMVSSTQDAKNNVIPVSNGYDYRWYSSIYGY